MTFILHCWGNKDGQISEIDIVAQVIDELNKRHDLQVEIIPDSSFYTCKLPYLESPRGPISDICSIFDTIMKFQSTEGKQLILERSVLNQMLLKMEKIMLFVLYDEQYEKTRKFHSGLNKWPMAYYPPIWMRKYMERKCIDMTIGDAEDDSDVPVIHDIQKREIERKSKMKDVQRTLRVDSMLSSDGSNDNETAKLFRDCIESYRGI